MSPDEVREIQVEGVDRARFRYHEGAWEVTMLEKPKGVRALWEWKTGRSTDPELAVARARGRDAPTEQDRLVAAYIANLYGA